MGIAGGEKAMRLREVRIILDRQEQLWQGLVEAPTKKQRHADRTENLAEPAARAEAQRNLKALDSQSGLAIFPRMPRIYQPRAKLGLSASARSTSAIMAPTSSPK